MRRKDPGGGVPDSTSEDPSSYGSCGEDAASKFSTATSVLASGGGATSKSFKNNACRTEDFHTSPKESSALDSKAAGVTADFLDPCPQGSSALGLEAAGTALLCPIKDDVTRGTNPYKRIKIKSGEEPSVIRFGEVEYQDHGGLMQS